MGITVVDKRKSSPVNFCKIAVGGTFLSGNIPYIRIQKVGAGLDSSNAFCLSSGRHYLFSNDKDVTEVDIEIIIKNRT